MKPFDVFFYEAFEEEQQALKSFLPDHIRAGFTSATIQEAGLSDSPVQLISIRTQSIIPPEWAGNLKALLSRSTGYDHLIAYQKKTETTAHLGYLPLYCARAVAEQAMLLWTALMRRLPQQLEQFNTFYRDGITGQELGGKTLLVVGAGNIGGEIIRIGQALNMNVLAVDPIRKHDAVKYVEFDDKKSEADIIVCAMNLTEENRGYFSAKRFSGIKPGALFVNIARGELSPPDVLLEQLRSGNIGGIGLDVYDEESALAAVLRNGQPTDSPTVRATLELRKHPNVICTPHNAFNTQEAVLRKSEQSIQQIEHFMNNGNFIWQQGLLF